MNSIHVIIISLFSVFLSYYIIKIYNINNKSKYLNFNSRLRISFFNFQKSKISKKLAIIDNPYGLNVKNYFIIKYILSVLILFLSIIRTRNIFLSLILSVFIYFLPNLLIESFFKNENIKIINELIKINSSLILSLSCRIPFDKSLNLAIDLVKYSRLKKELYIFYNDYKLYNYNINKAIINIKPKFKSNEFEMFLNTLMQGEKEGNLIENLNAFSESLELMYFKYLKFKETQRILFLTFSSLLILINMISIVMYPIILEITENLKIIFK